jgi:hypothetical protein
MRQVLFNLSRCFPSGLAKSHNRPDPWVADAPCLAKAKILHRFSGESMAVLSENFLIVILVFRNSHKGESVESRGIIPMRERQPFQKLVNNDSAKVGHCCMVQGTGIIIQ